MNMRKLQFLAAITGSLISISASAAEPCKSYIKFDLGYGIGSAGRAYSTVISATGATPTTNVIASGFDKTKGSMMGAAGFGYAFNDAMRAEMEIKFAPKMRVYGPAFATESKEVGGTAKVLYDFNNPSTVTPFMFGGLGFTNSKTTLKPYVSPVLGWTASQLVLAGLDSTGAYVNDGTNVTTYGSLKMPSKTFMTYQAGFGLALKAAEAVHIDLTYGLSGRAHHHSVENAAVLNVDKTKIDLSTASLSIADSTDAAKVPNSMSFQSVKVKQQLDQSLTVGVRFTL